MLQMLSVRSESALSQRKEVRAFARFLYSNSFRCCKEGARYASLDSTIIVEWCKLLAAVIDDVGSDMR